MNPLKKLTLLEVGRLTQVDVTHIDRFLTEWVTEFRKTSDSNNVKQSLR